VQAGGPRAPAAGGTEAELARLALGPPRLAPAPDRAGERADHVGRQAQCLADLADGAAGAIADHRGGEPGALPAVFAVDILDHLLPPLMLAIDVDVERLVARRADE